ncbi:chorismate mutase [Aestuariivirga litoralis]|nr:chorismate mutase [Aestuariivirga litoralis]
MTAQSKSSPPPELGDLRHAIDGVDGALVALYAKRLGLVNQVLEVKKQYGLPASIPERVEEVIVRVRGEAERAGFLPDVAEKLWRLLIKEMIVYEEGHLK